MTTVRNRKLRRRSATAAFVVSVAALVMSSAVWDLRSYPPPSGTVDYCASYFLGYLGLWGEALVRARRALDAVVADSDIGIDDHDHDDHDDLDAVATYNANSESYSPLSKKANDEGDGQQRRISRRRRLAAVNRRIATIYERMGRYDEALAIIEGEVLPLLRRRRRRRRRGGNGGGNGDENDKDNTNDDDRLGTVQVWELTMTDLSELYRKRGMYREGLRVLAEAQEGFDQTAPASHRKGNGAGSGSGGRIGSINDALAGFTRSTLQKEHELRGEEIRELAAALEKQREYVVLLEDAARRYNFSARRSATTTMTMMTMMTTETATAMDREKQHQQQQQQQQQQQHQEYEEEKSADGYGRDCDAVTIDRTIIYAPSNALFATVVALLLLGPVRAAWTNLLSGGVPNGGGNGGIVVDAPAAPAAALTKLSRLRRLLTLFNACLTVGATLAYWNWSTNVDAVRFASIGRVLHRFGQYDASLAAYDLARCSMLHNVREESVLMTEAALDVFAGATYVLNDDGNRDLADELVGEVDDLIEAHAVLSRPSFYVAGHYLKVGEMYFRRAEDDSVTGNGQGDDYDDDYDDDDAAVAKTALWQKEGRRYHALAEAETRSLARYIEEMVEEEVERMSKEMAGRHRRNSTSKLEVKGKEGKKDDDDEGVEPITVRIDR